MRLWLLVLSCILTNFASAQGLLPFPNTAPVTFYFKETYKDLVIPDPDFEDEFLTRADSSLLIEGSGPLTGFDITTLDEFSPYSITVGDFDKSGTLGEDEFFDSTNPNDKSVNIILLGFNDDGDEIEIGSVGIGWTTTRVSFTVTVADAPFDWTVATADYYPDVNDNNIISDSLLAAFSFGPFGFDTRTCHMIGTASSAPDPTGRVPENLSNVTLEGSIDSVAPTVLVTSPSGGTLTVNDVTPDLRFTFSGTAGDIRKIGTTSYPGTVDRVEVRVSTATTEGEYEDATLDANFNWVLANVQLEPGLNSYQVRVTDDSDNVTETTETNLRLNTAGDLTITADATGYLPGDAGKAAGTVSGAFFVGKEKKFTMNVGATPAPKNFQRNVAAGQLLKLTAVPAPGSVFNGWTGSVNGVVKFTGVTETLIFETKPDLIVTAKFVPNPFAPTVGSYNGLLHGDSTAERGLFNVIIGANGSFTGKAQFGTVLLPLKGKILGSGFWSGTIKKGLVIYTVSFQLNVNALGDRQLIGSVVGGEIDADVTADLKDWRKPNPKKGDPGKSAEAFAASYTVLLPQVPGSADMPFGVGFGRITITKLGTVTFLGTLGDGSPAKASTVLIQRNSGPVLFSLYIPLDAKKGSIAGIVSYDSAQPNTDLTGTLDWVEPATKGIEPQPFEGQVLLHGSRYSKPNTGELIMLNGTGGVGTATILAPIYSKPAGGTSLALNFTGTTLNAATQSFGPLGTELLKLKFVATTGLFSGSFKDPTTRKIVPFKGAVSRKANGGNGAAAGVFVRGNRTGVIGYGP